MWGVMSDRFVPLSPEKLAGWVFADLKDNHQIFGLPRELFWVPGAGSVALEHLGRRLETPIGVAAGPHTQLAHNIVVAWLHGARFLELKTVQTLDELEIARPCIDAEDATYNCEWSQELKIDQSIDEYLTAWVLIHALRHRLGWKDDPTDPGFLFNISVGYEHYPGLARHKANTTYEWVFAFSWPNILPAGFIPSYIAHYEYPAESGEAYNHITGWVHRFCLSYDLSVPDMPQPLRLSSEVAYTDGLGGASHDWSYATFGLSTVLKLGDNTSFVPGVYHQLSMDDSVNTRDVTYTMLSLRSAF